MSDELRIRPLPLPLADDDLRTIARIHWHAAHVAYAYRNWNYSLAEVIDWYAGKSADWDWTSLAWRPGPAGGEIPVGFGAATESFLDQLFVMPEHQRSGAGRALLLTMLRLAPRPVDLHVLKGNLPARAFYEHHGFLPEKSWWDRGENETVVLYRLV